ncbi:twin-arginine translocase subunit TatC [Paracoccus suum]|uniref:Sec-independent protein translocase protein TatC n=1 Tax=Paracoccus suum TaxID=2259340 RepID=A0A344PGG4_9RHOB|nr:twin-arginine translocase subunit TatC [Paracoccus suum]AXC48469.1 twin-arginine translocase subunit TatC [Paracoccus suum]
MARTPKPDDISDSSAPLIEHLKELRTRLLWSILAFVVAMVLCFSIWNPIFNYMTHPICEALGRRGQDCGLILLKLQEGFFVALQISFVGGFALSFPVIGYQLWRFVAPGLYRSEKNAFLPFLLASPIMFFLGAAFAYFAVLPAVFDFFLTFQQGPLVTPAVEGAQDAATAVAAGTARSPVAGIVFQGSVGEYLSLTMRFIMAFGICFQLPVLLTLLGKAGIVSADGLSSARKYALVLMLIVAAVVTPGPDMTSQLIMFAAVYPLYEISIILIRRIERRREADLRAQGLWVEDDEPNA